jgi:hypothetical protein
MTSWAVVTVTVSLAGPASNGIFTSAVDPTEMRISRATAFLKPVASTEIVYIPGWRVWKSNVPPLLDIAERSAAVWLLTTVTVAPATTAPLWS